MLYQLELTRAGLWPAPHVADRPHAAGMNGMVIEKLVLNHAAYIKSIHIQAFRMLKFVNIFIWQCWLQDSPLINRNNLVFSLSVKLSTS